MKAHVLKTQTDAFQDMLEGELTFNHRNNDRGFQAGDHVIFAEVSLPLPIKNADLRTGRYMLAKILYLMQDEYNVRDNYSVFSFTLPKLCGLLSDGRLLVADSESRHSSDGFIVRSVVLESFDEVKPLTFSAYGSVDFAMGRHLREVLLRSLRPINQEDFL